LSDFASNGAARVVVLPDREMVRGLDSMEFLKEGAPADRVPTPVQTYPLAEAFTRQWSTDAHFVLYVVEPFDPADPVFRLNKTGPLLAELLRFDPPGIPTVYLIAVDFDTEGHVPWNAENWGRFVSLLKSLENTRVGERLRQSFASYSTRKGWRWVFRVRGGIPAACAEPYIRGLILELRAGGLPVDATPVLSTWNCDFRLPCVTRGGSPTWEDPFFVPPDLRPEKFIEKASIVPQGESDPVFFSTPGIDDSGMPSEDECISLMTYLNSRGHPVETAFAKAFRKDTEGKDFWPYVFGVKAFKEPEGTRHDRARFLIMSAATFVFRYENTSPAHLYALFRLVANEMHDQAPAAGRKKEVWRLCVGAWNRILAEETQIKRIKLEEEKEVAERKSEGFQRITDAVSRWYPGLPADEVASKSWIMERLILRAKGNRYYVMKPSGYYSSIATEPEGLLSRIRQLGMDAHIDVWIKGKMGDRPVRRDELALKHVRNVDRVEMRPEVEGGYLLNPHKDEGLVLVTPSFRRRKDLEPAYSPDVDLLLRAYGGEQYDRLIVHIASFLAFERGGTAAMSFNIMPGSGKKLVAHGFLESMEEPDHATGEDLVQRFNSRLATAPFLFVNEGLPEQKFAHYHPSDTFRKVITGDYFQSEGKGIDAVSIKSPIRVFMTANHWRLIDALGEGRDLSAHEREALGVRLVHYDAGDAPGRLLREREGFKWTAGWIEGDGGEPSQYVIARHFLWIYEKYGRHLKPKGRLLVEGDPNQPAIRRLRARGGSTPIVMEAIVRLLSRSAMGAATARQGVRTTPDGRLFVTTSAILDFWRDNLTRGSAERLTLARVYMSLRGLVVGQLDARVPSAAEEKARFHEIDVFFLAEEAHEAGWLCAELDRLVELRHATLAHANGNGHANGVHRTASGRILAPGGGA